MKLKQFMALTFLGFLLSIPALADDTKKEDKEPSKTENKDKPKPYGCFRDLRWGMSFNDAQKSLGITLKKSQIPFGPHKGETRGIAEIKIGEKDYHLALVFNSSGLYTVGIDPQFVLTSMFSEYEQNYNHIKSCIDSYNYFKPPLIDKFGKPVDEAKIDNGADVDLINNILAHKAALSSTWETEESTITLSVGADRLSLLLYEKKTPKDEKKPDL